MVVSMLSTINALQLMGSRTLFALGRDRLFASGAAAVNRGGTPAYALWAGTVVGALFLLTRTFNAAIALLSFFFVANYALSFISLFVLRAREPELSAKHRAWGHPWTTALALTGSVAFLCAAVASDTRSSLISLALLALSYPVFRVMRVAARNVAPEKNDVQR
jgi:APA family basic amino acid/polyamine antiporter